MFKKTLTLAAALAVGLCATSAFAGDAKDAKQRAQLQQLDSDWSQTLNLKGEKAEKVQKIQKEFKEEHQELTEMHQKFMQDLVKDSKEDLQEVLGEKELSQLEEMFKAHEEQVEQSLSLSAE